MVRYRLRNKNRSDVIPCQFEKSLNKNERYYKARFKSDGNTENRMYMIRKEGRNACRIDVKYSPYGTFVTISDFENSGIEDKLKSISDFNWIDPRKEE